MTDKNKREWISFEGRRFYKDNYSIIKDYIEAAYRESELLLLSWYFEDKFGIYKNNDFEPQVKEKEVQEKIEEEVIEKQEVKKPGRPKKS